jgi:hypothetical protein
MTFQQIYEAISSLPLKERRRLVERVSHDVAAGAKETDWKTIGKGSPLDGLFSDIPNLVDEVCAAAYQDRAPAAASPRT